MTWSVSGSWFGEGRKTIVFGPTIAYCAELCQQFNDAGIMAATFTGETPDHERKALLEEYRKQIRASAC